MPEAKVAKRPLGPHELAGSKTGHLNQSWGMLVREQFRNFTLFLIAPPHLKRFYRTFQSAPFRMLDVGCGANAPTKTRRYFPLCEYHGVDISENGLSPSDRAYMAHFYCANLDEDPLHDIPDEYFDVIVMSHVIEHVHHGLEALTNLAKKAKPGGFIYVEFPGVRSLSVPSARSGFLHFHDDPTHVRLYTVPEIVNVLLENNYLILKAGTRRDCLRLLATPFLFVRGLVLNGDPWSGRMWDFFGIAEFVYARKRQVAQVIPRDPSGCSDV